ALVKIRSTMDQHSSAIDQATLALFINEGFFLSHIKRMRKLYAERREFFMKEFNKLLGGPIHPSDSGSRTKLRRLASLRSRFRESRARLHRHRNQTLTAIILLHRGEAQASVCFRFRCLDSRANSRKPPEACICTQVTTRILIFRHRVPDAQGKRRARPKHLAFV